MRINIAIICPENVFGNILGRFKYILLLLIIMGFNITSAQFNAADNSDNVIIVTVPIPFFKEIVEEIASPYVIVNVLYPEGVEPHEYQLTPKEVEIASKSDLIISTSHFPGEIKLEEMAKKGQIKAKLITLRDFMNYGLKLLINPYTGKENLHAYWTNPLNSIAIARAITDALKEVDPQHSSFYEARFNLFKLKIIKAVELLKNYFLSISKSVKVVITIPAEQYLAEWLGMNIVMFIVKEHGVEPTPSDLERLASLMRDGKVDIVLMSEHVKDTKIGQYVRTLALQYGVPIAYVKILCGEGIGVGELISYNMASIITALMQSPSTSRDTSSKIYLYMILILLTISLIEFGVIIYLKRRLQLE